MAGFAREVARRVYAAELRDSDLTFRENEDQYAPLYLITTTGARCNPIPPWWGNLNLDRQAAKELILCCGSPITLSPG